MSPRRIGKRSNSSRTTHHFDCAPFGSEPQGRRQCRHSSRPPLRLAATHAVESLEARRLLASLTPQQIDYDWNHMKPAAEHAVAVMEYLYPAFQEKLDADLAAMGLTPIDPQEGTLAGIESFGKGRLSRHHHKPPHPHVKPHHHRRHNRDGQGPTITNESYLYDYLPNQLQVTFSEDVTSADWNNAVTVIDLNTGTPVPISGSYSSGTLVYNLNNSAELSDGNYAAILHGSQISDTNGNKLAGDDGVAGDDHVYNFFFNQSDLNHDGNIDIIDLNILIAGYNTSGGATFSQGDTNYDGKVDINDLNRLIRNFGVSLAPLPSPIAPTMTSATTSSITISWPPSADSRVTHYDVYRDSTLISGANGVTGTSYTDSDSSLGATPHSYFIVAKDNSHDSSYPSDILVASTAPQATGTFITNTLPQQISFAFNQPMHAANWLAAISVIDLNTNAAVPVSNPVYHSDNTLTFDLNNGTMLADGNDAAILHGSMILNPQGVALAGSDGTAGHDFASNFFFYEGDFTLDRNADFSDFTRLTQHNGMTSGATFIDGDANFDGAVNSADFDILSPKYGTSLPLLVPPGQPTLITMTSGVEFSWQASTSPNATYDVYRASTSPNTGISAYSLLPASDISGGTTCTDTSVQGGVTYTYFVVTRDPTGASSYLSPELVVTTAIPPPQTPGSLVQINNNSPNSILFSWTDSDPSAVAYNIYRDGTLLAGNVTATAYLDIGTTSSHTYAVAAVNARGDESPTRSTNGFGPTGAAPTGYSTTTLAPPASISTSTSGSTVAISWFAVTGGTGAITYEIDRDGVAIAATSALTYTDNPAAAGTTYAYTVIAYDSSFDKSPPSAQSTPSSTVADTTAPNVPLDVQVVNVSTSDVQLSWVQPWDDVGVTSYAITRVNPDNSSTPLTSSFSTLDDAGSFTPGSTYQYRVVAKDAVGNQSQYAPISVIIPGGTVTPTDSSPNQYIPPDWPTAFYNPTDGLTAVLRQRMAFAGISPQLNPPPAAASWYDSSGQSPDTLLSNNLFRARNVYYVDRNGDGLLDPGEAAWVDNNYNGKYDTGDQLITGYATPEANASGTPSNLWYLGTNNDGQFNPTSDTLITNVNLLHGTQGQFAYQDLAGLGYYKSPDPVWQIASGAGNAYQTGEAIISGGSVQPGTWGKTNGISATQIGSQWLVWADSTSFRADVPAFYGGLAQLIPHFADKDSPNPYSVGSFLENNLRITPTPGAASILSIDNSDYPNVPVVVTFSAPTNAIAGDYILLGDGNWYPVATVSTSGASITLGVTFCYAPVSSSYSLINWTKVPQSTDSATGLSFQYERGVPDSSSILFPQNFNQLQTALNQLKYFPKVYGEWLMDTNTSSSFIPVANYAMQVYRSIYGNQTTDLEDDLTQQQADPGFFFHAKVVNDLWVVVKAIAHVVYVRSGTSINGWPTGGPYTFDTNAGRVLLGFSSGNWPAAVQEGAAINNTDWTTAASVLDTIVANHLVIQSNHSPDYSETFSNVITVGDGAHEASNVGKDLIDWQTDPVPSNLVGSASANSTGIGQLTASNPAHDNTNLSPEGNWWAAGDMSSHVTAPPASNQWGGADMTGNVIPAPTPTDDIGASTWQWGQTYPIASYSTDQIVGLLQGAYSEALQDVANTSGAGHYEISLNPSMAPHLFWDGSKLTIDIDSNGLKLWSFTGPIDFFYHTPGTLYGVVPNSGSFTYTSTGSYPTLPSVGQPPSDTDIVLTTPMDYRNVTPDTNLDGIVQVPADLASFGNDTGVIAFQADRDAAQSYLPIFTNTSSSLPIHGYIEQGAFSFTDTADSPDNVAPLSDDLSNAPGADQNGLPYAYSLSTYARINLLLNDGSNHIKRIEIIRPGGNAVVFNFTWSNTTNSFSPIGVPMGWNNRDQSRTYVLRDLNGQNIGGLNYALEFASGITQTFFGGLYSVSDSTGLSTIIPGGGFSVSTASGSSNRYNITTKWQNGQISAVDYSTLQSTGAHTIETTIGYGSNNAITSLDKEDITTTTPMGEFSYSLEANTIHASGQDIARTGSVAGGSVTILQTSTDADNVRGSRKEVWTFNTATGMITTDAVTLDEQSDWYTPDTQTTTYAYRANAIGPRLANGAAPWGEVTKISYPDFSWIAYTYRTDTGWVSEQITPFKNGLWNAGNEAYNVTTYFNYDASQSGNGQAADPMNLVEPPRVARTEYPGGFDADDDPVGVVASLVFNKYGAAGVQGSANLSNIITRTAATASDTWSSAVFQTSTVINGYASETVTGPGGSSTTSNTGSLASSSQSWMGHTLAASSTPLNGFGYASGQATNSALGIPSVNDTASSTDAFGRTTANAISGGVSTGATYNNEDWFGPSKVIESDGSETDYTYNALGGVATKVIYANSSLHAVRYTYVYDMNGNVISLTTAPVAADAPAVTNVYVFDSLNRLVDEIDNFIDLTIPNHPTADATANHETYYNRNGLTVTIYPNYPDPATEVDRYYRDGTRRDVTGSATTSVTYDEGVVFDSRSIDGNVYLSDSAGGGTVAGRGNYANLQMGSLWTSVTEGTGNITTRSFTNMLGEQYLTQQNQDATQDVVDTVTQFDKNGRPIETYSIADQDPTKQPPPPTFVAFNQTLTVYDPQTGQVGATVTDMNANGVYDPGIDRKSIAHATMQVQPTQSNPNPPVVDETSADTGTSDYQGTDSQDLSDTGVDDSSDSVALTSNGSDEKDTENGLTTDTNTPPPVAGAWTTTTVNPDQTKTVDVYSDGLLASETTLGTNNSTLTVTSYTYNGLRQVTAKTDFSGTTLYTWFQDGTQKSVQLPGHNAQQVTAVNQRNDAATQVSRPDGGAVSTPQNSIAQTSAQYGSGLLAANFGYDITATGNLTSLTTYRSGINYSNGTLSGQNAATTRWGYDPSTGLLASKQYADGSSDSYFYNTNLQLKSVIEPGIVASSFGYNGAGEQTSSSMTDSQGNVAGSQIDSTDEFGHPIVVSAADNGRTTTELNLYDVNNQNYLNIFESALAAVHRDYYPTSLSQLPSNGSGSPQALSTLSIQTIAGGTLASTAYTYDSSSKRIATITVNGVKVTYQYFSDSNQVQYVTATVPGNNSAYGTSETYLRDSTDKARVSSFGANTDSGAVGQSWNEVVSSYNQQDQINGQTITRKDVSDGGSVSSNITDVMGYTYSGNEGDALTNVTDNGNGAYTYNFDGVGNITNNNLGTLSSVNEYSGLTYNRRGDVTDDGTYAYAYDPNDRLIQVTPHDTSKQQLKYGYDSSGRRMWKDVYNYVNGVWTYAYSRDYLYDGDTLIGVLDGSGNMVTGYTWGPTGLIAVTDYTASGGPKTYVAVEDLSGNVVQLLDPIAGTIVASYHYDPYGNLLSESGPAKDINEIRGKSLLVDKEAPDIQHALNRDARQNLWLERDPAGELQGGLNLYQVDAGDPINKSDPSGLRWETIKSLWAAEVEETKAAFILATNPAQYAVTYGPVYQQMTSDVGDWVGKTLVDSATNPTMFQNGEFVGGVNAAAKMVTSIPQADAAAREAGGTLLLETMDALIGAPDRPESAYAEMARLADPEIANLELPDQLRQKAFDSTIDTLSMGSPANAQALRSGATVGAAVVNGALIASAFIDPAAFVGEATIATDGLFGSIDVARMMQTAATEVRVAPVSEEISSLASVNKTLFQSDFVPVEDLTVQGQGQLQRLAGEIRNAGGNYLARVKKTVAVGRDSAGQLVVSASNPLDFQQRAAAAAYGIRIVDGETHAEINLLQEYPTLWGIDLKIIGTSARWPCGPDELDCAAKLAARGVKLDNR